MKYLYIWRFQPFHLGHLDAIHQAIERGATLIIIGLGSPHKSDKDNPWSVEQRKEMIVLWLQDANIDRTIITFEEIPDFPTDLERYTYIIDQLPRFDIVMSGNTRVQEIFASCPHEVFDPEEHAKVDIHATQLRLWLEQSELDKIKLYLPSSVFEYIKSSKISTFWE